MKYRGLHSILKNAGYLIGGQGINTLARAVYAVVLARTLGPDSYGTLNYGLSWYLTLLPLTLLGLDVLMSREIGKDRKQGIEIISNTLSIRIIVAVLLTILSIAGAWTLESDSKMSLLITILSLALFGRSLFIWSKGVFTAIEAVRHSFKLEALLRPGEIVIGLAVLFLGGGLIGIALVHTLSWWIQGLWSFSLMKRVEPGIRMKFDAPIISQILRASIPLGLTSLFTTWFVQGPIILFRSLAGFGSDLGQLTLIVQIFLMMSSIPMGIGNAALPILTRSLIRQDGKSDLFIDGMLRILIIIGGLAGLFFLAFGEPFVILVFGSGYALAGQQLGYMALILIPFSCSITIARISVAEGQYTSVARANFYSALLFTACFYPALTHFGFPGILISMAAGQILRMALMTAIHVRVHPLNLTTVLVRPMALLSISILVLELLRPYNPYFALLSAVLIISIGLFLAGIVRRTEIRLMSNLLFNRHT